MNNNRLSTFDAAIRVDREELILEIQNLLSGPSNFEIRDGRKFIKSLNRFEGAGQQPAVKLLDDSGCIIKAFASVSDCAKFLGVSRSVVYNRIEKNKAIILDNKDYYIKREDK